MSIKKYAAPLIYLLASTIVSANYLPPWTLAVAGATAFSTCAGTTHYVYKHMQEDDPIPLIGSVAIAAFLASSLIGGLQKRHKLISSGALYLCAATGIGASLLYHGQTPLSPDYENDSNDGELNISSCTIAGALGSLGAAAVAIGTASTLYCANTPLSPSIKYGSQATIPAVLTAIAGHFCKTIIQPEAKPTLLHAAAGLALAGCCTAAALPSSGSKLLTAGILLTSAAVGMQSIIKAHNCAAELDYSAEEWYGTCVLAGSAVTAFMAHGIVNHPYRTTQIMGAAIPSCLAYFLLNQGTFCKHPKQQGCWYGIKSKNKDKALLIGAATLIAAGAHVVASRHNPYGSPLFYYDASLYCAASALGMGISWMINGMVLKRAQKEKHATYFPWSLLAYGPGALLTVSTCAALKYNNFIA